jgi:hypothetical protein
MFKLRKPQATQAIPQCEAKLWKDGQQVQCTLDGTRRGLFGQHLCADHCIAHMRTVIIQQVEAREAGKR